MIAHKGVRVRNLQFLCETERGVVAGVGHRHDDVGFDRKFARQLASHVRPHFADIHAADDAVRPREINVFEHAEGWLLRWERVLGAQSVFIDDQDFARLDFPNELRVDQVEGACF